MMKLNTLKRTIAVIAVVAVLCLAFAGCTATGAAATDGGGGGGAYTFIMFGAIIVVFYFFLIRPENKKKKKLAEMRSSLSVGDQITTIGGMVGRIVAMNDDFITFETGEDRVRIQVTKWAISTTGKAAEESK